jgi:hypothetical protein
VRGQAREITAEDTPLTKQIVIAGMEFPETAEQADDSYRK